MARKLNKIRDEVARRDLETIPKSLATRLERLGSSEPGLGHWNALHGMYLRVALSKYQLEFPDREVIDALRSACESHVEASRLIAGGAKPEATVWSLFFNKLGLVGAFGSAEDRRVAAQFPEQLIRGTPSVAAPGVQVSRLWRSLALTGFLDQAAFAAQLKRCEADNADRWDAQWTHAIARCFTALAAGSSADFNQGLDEIAAFTTAQAVRGGWRTQSEGQMSLPALGLCRLALERGMQPASESAYIPISLLEI